MMYYIISPRYPHPDELLKMPENLIIHWHFFFVSFFITTLAEVYYGNFFIKKVVNPCFLGKIKRDQQLPAS